MPGQTIDGLKKNELALSALLAGLSILFFCRRAWHGVWFLGFVDETEHFVGGMLLDRGGILYRTFVDAHGPVIFILAQFYGAIFGWAAPNWARGIAVVLLAGAASAVFTSAALLSIFARLWAGSTFVWLITTVWIVQSLNMLNYHEVAGCLMAAGLASFVIPSWLQSPFGRGRAVVSGACLALLVCTAYSFLPAAVLVGASAAWSARRQGRMRDIRGLLIGFCAGLAAIVLWLLRFGDLVGYFVFHFAALQFVYAKYTGFGWATFVAGLVPSSQPAALVHGAALTCCAFALAIFLVLDAVRRRPSRSMAGPIILGFLGIIALCARGGTLFQDGSFVVTAFSIVSVAAAALMDAAIRTRHAWTQRVLHAAVPVALLACLSALEMLMHHAANSPFGFSRAQLVQVPPIRFGLSDDPEYRRIRALTLPTDRILALPYAPHVFMLSGRMPMDRYTVYLPWDAEYAKAPWLGEKRDLCEDMAKTPPKLVYFDGWVVWGRWAMQDYAPCFTHLLAAAYLRQPDFPNLYVLK